ncbi:MAG: PhoH family protein [Alphaproteobacteria bacterium]|jgi:phosphate starvation-inducible PhoH-like protein|nr:PhoH family protein [Candidatus Jidaibacter sp.]
MESSLSLHFKNNALLPILYGEKNKNIAMIEKMLSVSISTRGNYLAISGDSNNISLAAGALESLYHKLEGGAEDITREQLLSAIDGINTNTNIVKSKNVKHSDNVLKTKKKTIFPFTDKQHEYIKTLLEKDIVFGIGAAGTGKTYLAMATAVSMFIEKKVNKIILTRPAVEAGEKLGFLPGDIKEKVDPYLQPLYDALYDMLPPETVERYFATRELQIAPLAFMRGRTLNNAFVILDEAQNTTVVQMKMFLTRLGAGSKFAITGDLTQIDLPLGAKSGLIDAIDKVKHIQEIGLIQFDSSEVVRHPLIKKIIDAYES